MNLKRTLVPMLMFAAAALTDDKIRDKVMIKLNRDPVAKGGGFEIDVKQGVVMLTGKVESEKQKAKAENLAHKVSGVKSVQNQLVVATH